MVNTLENSIGNCLLNALLKRGVDELFGVPGDYVLLFDKMIENHDIRFINCTSEMTAGYMANAYACVRGLGAVCVTYGVGINILNAIAQAYVESIPIVFITGAPGINEYAHGRLLHHLFNKPHPTGEREHIQLDIFKHVTVDQVVLGDPAEAIPLIERALDRCLLEKKPVYIELPRDQVNHPISNHVHVEWKKPQIKTDNLEQCLKEISTLLSHAEKPVIWAGHEIQRYNLADQMLKFAERHQIPIASSLLGRTVIGERHPLSIGIYEGQVSLPEIQQFVESTDCLLQLGVLLTDVNTGLFTAKLPENRIVISASGEVKVGTKIYKDLPLDVLMNGLSALDLGKTFSGNPIKPVNFSFQAVKDEKITTARIFECLRAHLTDEHLIVSDFGDCLFNSFDLVLAQNSFIASSYFATIGFAAPGAVGAQLAAPERRVVGLIGDGAFQVSSTELSTAVRYGIDPVIIILNNHGYGIERPLLEGSYNDILDWNYSALTQVFGGGVGVKTTTEDEFEKALVNAFSKRGEMHIIEVPVDKLDFSSTFFRFVKAAKSNK